MKKFKRITAVLLSVLMLISAFPIISNSQIIESGTCGYETEWALYDTGELVISGRGETQDNDIGSEAPTPWWWCEEQIKTARICDGITSIGYMLFWRCDNLTTVTIGDDVTEIGSSAFESLTNLTDVHFGKSVVNIGWSSFGNCNLKSVVLPKSVEKIGGYSFFDNKNLKQIQIQNNVTDIEDNAFYGCTSLRDVYYTGTEEEWKNIYIFEGNECLLNANIHFESPVEDDSPTEISGNFKYYSQIKKETVQYPFTYDEYWFKNPSTEYNHSLAQMSIRMAIAGATKTATDIKDLYNKLEISYTSSSISYPTPSFDYETFDSTIGYAIGSKKLNLNVKEDCTLVVVTVRGGGYKSEWADNFNIGTTSEHNGFSKAAGKVTAAVKDYINKEVKTSSVKIWITGFSRGAAVSNLTAHNLNSWSGKINKPSIKQSDIFAYCFECPRNVRSDSPSYKNKESNIINIINDSDLVTKVAPLDWDFHRYGLDYYLPTGDYCDNYKTFYQKQVNQYIAILKKAGVAEADSMAKDLSTGVKNQVSFTSDTVDALASFFDSQSVYCNGYEDTMCKVVGETLGKDDYQSGTVFEAITESFIAFPILHPVITTRLVSEGKRVFYAHHPELCLSWMDALSGKEEYISPRRRRLTVACPVDVYVYNSKEQLVAQIVNEKEVELENSTIEYYINEAGEKVVILPNDGEYSVKIIAREDGTMTYRIEDTDVSNNYEHTVEYTEIPIQKNVEYVGDIEIPDTEKTETIDYPLTDSNKKEYTPDIDKVDYEEEIINPFIDVPDNAWYTKEVIGCKSKGYISGTSANTFSPNNDLSRAEFVQILADVSGDNYKSLEYKPIFTDVPNNKWYTKAVMWCAENNITSGTSATTFSPDLKVSREQLVTFFYNYAKNKGYDISASDDLSNYTDAKDVSGWAKTAVQWAVAEKLITGTTNTTITPKGIASRAQAAVIFRNFVEEYLSKQ